MKNIMNKITTSASVLGLALILNGCSTPKTQSGIRERCGLENEYIRLTISETKKGRKVDLNLESVQRLSGDYSRLVNRLADGEYKLTFLDEKNKPLNSYPIMSRRFINVDYINKSETIEQEKGIIVEILPYDERIRKIKLKSNTSKSEFPINFKN